jgi:ligand-binding sensor domain-containing protein
VRVRHLVVAIVVLGLLLGGCGTEEEETLAPPSSPSAGDTGFAGPGYDPGMPAPPAPTATPFTGGGKSPAPGRSVDTPEPSFTPITSTTTVATPLALGWTRYASINDVRDLAFAPSGTLWAATNGGLVEWDPGTETYTRYAIAARSLAVGPDGTLWLATETGLCQFDGATCEWFSAADGLLSTNVLAIDVGPDGVLWVGTDEGVSRFDGRAWKSYPAPVPCVDLAVAANGEVWAATGGGVGRYLPAEDTWITYTEEHGLPTFHSEAIAVGLDGDVLVYVLWEGVYRFDGTGWHAADTVPGGLISDLAYGDDGSAWAATVGGTHYPGGSLATHDGNEWVDVTNAHGLHSIQTIAPGPGGTVAAGTNLGLGIYQGGEWRLLRDGPTHDQITTVAVTPEGAAWFGFGDHSVATARDGLSRFDGQDWSYSLDDAEVNVLAVAPDGSLWAGVACEVRRFDGIAWEAVGRCGDDLPLGNILEIAFTPDGAAWVANGFGVARYDGDSWVVYERLVHSLDAAPDGTLWVNGWEGTQGSQYVARFDGETWTNFGPADSVPGGFSAGAVTPDGLVWGLVQGGRLASFDGRSWTDEDSWAFYDVGGHLPLVDIYNLTVAPDGALWMTGSGQLARFDPRRPPDEAWTIYSSGSSLVEGYVGAMAFAPDGAIWIGGTRFEPSEAAGSEPVGRTAIPAATANVESEPTIAPYCGPDEASVDLLVASTTLRVGQVVTATILLANGVDSGVRLGQPQYRLVVQPSILVSESPELVRHTTSLEPGESEQAEFVLRADAPGRARLTAMTDYEMHAMDYSWGSWSGCRSGGLEIFIEP